jgi:FtsZ-binding cell division protein ZapB
MIAQLLQQKADEIKQKDFCTDELNTNQLQTEKKTRDKLDLEAKIADLEATIKRLTEEIDTLKAEVADLQLELKRVGEDREKASSEFQTTVADQRATQMLLKKALGVLEEYYGKAKASLAQQEPVGPPPPPGFKAFKKNAMSGGVMAEITQIIEDAVAMEKDAIKAEADQQKTYGAFVDETNASIEAKVKQIVRLTAERAKTEAELEEEQEASKRNIGLALVASVALSVPFYSKNLERLGTKIASGGKDDGYNKYADKPKKDMGKAASQFFFKRGFDD